MGGMLQAESHRLAGDSESLRNPFFDRLGRSSSMTHFREQAFLIGTPVKEKNGTWHGYTCGWYKTPEVPEGYVVKSALNPSEVKTYRADELVRWDKSREN